MSVGDAQPTQQPIDSAAAEHEESGGCGGAKGGEEAGAGEVSESEFDAAAGEIGEEEELLAEISGEDGSDAALAGDTDDLDSLLEGVQFAVR